MTTICYICDQPIDKEPAVMNSLSQEYAYARHSVQCAPGTPNWALVYPESLQTILALMRTVEVQ